MTEIKVQVEGMMCSMCQAHINDAVRRAFPVRKVSSSHTKGETQILTEEPIDEAELRRVIDATGYTAGEIHSSPYEKKGFLGLFGK